MYAVRPITPDTLYNILITHRIHSASHISLTLQQACSWNKLQLYRIACDFCLLQRHRKWLVSVTETQELTSVCYRDTRTDCCLLQRHKNWLLSVTESQELNAVCYRHKNWLLSVTETKELTAVYYNGTRTDCCLLQRIKNWQLSVTETKEQFAVCYRDKNWLLSLTETQELSAVC